MKPPPSLTSVLSCLLTTSVLQLFSSRNVFGDSDNDDMGNEAQVNAELVRQTLQQKIEGTTAELKLLLKRVIDKDPEYVPAHWHCGHVQMEESVESCQRRSRTHVQ